jgi:hypothetical protein
VEAIDVEYAYKHRMKPSSADDLRVARLRDLWLNNALEATLPASDPSPTAFSTEEPGNAILTDSVAAAAPWEHSSPLTTEIVPCIQPCPVTEVSAIDKVRLAQDCRSCPDPLRVALAIHKTVGGKPRRLL